MNNNTLMETLFHNETNQQQRAKRLKTFVYHNIAEAEEKVNHWLQNNDITIEHFVQSQCEKGGAFMFVISIVYSRNAVNEEYIAE